MTTIDQLALFNQRETLSDAASAWLVTSLARGRSGFSDVEFAREYINSRHGLPRHVKDLVLKAAIAPATSTAKPGATFLANAPTQSVFDRLGAIMVPLNGGRLGLQATTLSAQWIGENSPKPLAALNFTAADLKIFKLQSSVVTSNELLDFEVDGALAILTRVISSAVATSLDSALLDPASAAIAGVKPASLTNGITPIVGSGGIDNQLGQALAALPGATTIVVITSAQIAARLAAIAHLSSIGIRLLTSPAAAGKIIALDPNNIATKDAGVTIERASHAALIMDTAPAGVVQAAGAAPIHTSLWQNDLSAVRAERSVSWVARAGAVAIVSVA